MSKTLIQALSLSFLVILLFPLLISSTVPVAASEEAEEDNFTVMPNYRWKNESTTDTAVTEQLLGDNYEFYTGNNETSGSQAFEKSRQLNSRDFYYDTKFQLDTGGNETEVYRDMLGNAVDFVEGDYEGLYTGTGTNKWIDDGVFHFTSIGWEYIIYESTSGRFSELAVPFSLVDRIEFRAKFINNEADNGYAILYIRGGHGGYYKDYDQESIIETWGEWDTYSYTMDDFTFNRPDMEVNDHFFGWNLAAGIAGMEVYLDWFKVYLKTDYATHVEGEVEDTWDWEDSVEYFYDALGNVSDFNDGSLENWTTPNRDYWTVVEGNASDFDDGSTEGWIAGSNTDPVTNPGTVLYVESNVVASCKIVNTALSVDAAIYKHVCMSVHVNATSNDKVTDVCFHSGGDCLLTWAPDILVGSTTVVYGTFDEDWSGTETELEIRIYFDGTNTTNGVSIDYIYLFDTEYTDWNFNILAPDNYRNNNGWLEYSFDGYPTEDFEYMIINRTGLSIDNATYNHFCMEIKLNVTIDLTYIAVYDSTDTLVFVDSTNIGSGTYLIYGQFDADWYGTETAMNIVLRSDTVYNGASGTFNVTINMIYLYDTELGDLEGVTLADTYAYVNPEGFLVMRKSLGAGGVLFNGENILADNFDLFKLKIRTSRVSTLQMRDTGHLFWINTVASVWLEVEESISELETWEGTETYLYLRDGTTAVNYIEIDYWLIEGHYAEDEGFKFSLLNQDAEEGMYWQFTREQDSDEYTVTVDMLDITGVALSYEQAFSYSRTTDGWLHLDVDWHLDKKECKFVLEYENGTDIVSTRAMSDIYPLYGTGQLILLELGMPTLCLNNTLGPLARSLVIIDYIDADWQLGIWTEPDEDYDPLIGTTWAAGQSDQFSQASPFGASSLEASMSGNHAFYRQDIDRFDAVSFDFSQTIENLEASDYGYFRFELVNVLADGTLCPIAILTSKVFDAAAGHLWSIYVRKNSTTHVSDEGTAVFSDYAKGSMSCYRNPDSSLVVDYTIENDNATRYGSITASVTYTQEFLVFFNYQIYTDNGGSSDDVVRMKVSSFDVIRKDLFTGLIASVSDAVIGLVGWVLSPFIAIFMFLGSILKTGFTYVVDLLSPLITQVTGFLTSILSELQGLAAAIATSVWSGIGSALDFITDTIEEVGTFVATAIITQAASITSAIVGGLAVLATELANIIDDVIQLLLPMLISIAEDIAAWLYSVLAFLIVLALGIVEDIINLIIEAVFWFWDLLDLPDLIAIYDEIIVGAIQFLTSVPEMIIWILACWFWWAAGIFFFGFLLLFVLPVISSGSAGEFFEKFIHYNSKDATMGLELVGTCVHVPIGLVFWPCFFLMFIMEAL